jgi:predicted MFS family arabinose efflux permease
MAEEADRTAPHGSELTLIACIAICTLGALSGIAQTALPPVLPKISAHFAELPDAGALTRLMMTGLSAMMIVGALASGFLAERLGQLRLLYICLTLFGLAGLASYFVDNLYFLVAMRLVLGIVNAAAGVLGTALLATRLSAARRDRWLGLFIMIGTTASLFWVILAGVIGRIDWRLIFLLQLLAIPAALFIGATLEADKPSAVRSAKLSGRDAGIPWGMTLFGLACGAIGSSVFAFLPFHLHAIGYGDPAKIGPLLTASTAAGCATALGFGWIRKHAAAIPVFIGGFAVTGVGLFLALAAREYLPLALALAVYGAGFGVVTPNLFSACAAATPMALRTRVLGFMRAGFYAGPLAVQPFLELIVARSGPAGAIAGIASAALAAAGVFWLFRSHFDPVADELALAT